MDVMCGRKESRYVKEVEQIMKKRHSVFALSQLRMGPIDEENEDNDWVRRCKANNRDIYYAVS
jgi:hypothetical protein